ncbi:MAG: hypothetical protein K6A95_01520 [Bacteroidales bacterium]|nr:hypothetical protein [Bacteroidales bacterium]
MDNPIKVITTTVLLLFAALGPATAQRLSDRYFGISEQDFVDTIKIKIWDGAIIVPVEIEGETKNLMFDTGAGMGFWIGEEEEWMEPMGDSISTIDAQKRTKKKALMKIPSLKMGHLTIKGYPVVVDEGLDNFTCGIIDGAFGFDLVCKGISFKFDTRDSLLIMTSRKGFFAKEERGHAKVPYKVQGNQPFLWTKIPFARPRMLFDMGAVGGWFGLPQDLLDLWAKDNPDIKRQLDEMTVNVDTTVMTYAGLFGASYDTVINGELCFPTIEIGDIVLKDVWVSTATHNRAVGSALLEHVSLIIDAPKKSFYFLPHDGNPEITVANRSKGLNVVPAEEGDPNGALKALVRKGTKAYEDGLRTGDYLISVDGVPIPDMCTYMKLMYEKDVKHFQLRSPEGEIKEVEW